MVKTYKVRPPSDAAAWEVGWVINGRRSGDWPGTHAHALRAEDSPSDKSS
jgi:hypothetical protein